ncbi:response regulator [Acidovorax sp. FG27]|uniref:response regulator transcription factor n=1 Tax=Acidovorax sp. FG27 TaxID=3133652 RepID=UPI0030E8202C
MEDSQVIRDSLIQTLAELANTEVVAWATNPVDAEQALTEWHGQWELIVIDLFLASGTGLDVLKKIRPREPYQKAFVLSNYATADMRRRCFELSADGVFDKSTEIEMFLDRCGAIDRKFSG